MAEETKTPVAPPKSKLELRQEALRAYHDAASKGQRAEVIKKYPFLAEIFSASNHS